MLATYLKPLVEFYKTDFYKKYIHYFRAAAAAAVYAYVDAGPEAILTWKPKRWIVTALIAIIAAQRAGQFNPVTPPVVSVQTPNAPPSP